MIDIGAVGNFIGSDGFIWWIGKVVKTNKVIENTNQKNDLYYYRAKVRIVGWHTDDVNILPDDDLPWANILIPPTEGSGNYSIGNLHQLQGGEIVFGFFLDGREGQQPVIVGAFHSQFILNYGDGKGFNNNPKLSGSTSQEGIGRHQKIINRECASTYEQLAFSVDSNGKPIAYNSAVLENAKYTTASGLKVASVGSDSKYGGIIPLTECQTSVSLNIFNKDVEAAKTCIKTSSTVTSINSVKQGIDQFIAFFNQIQKDTNSWFNDRKQFLDDVEAFIRNISSLIGRFFTDAVSFVKDDVLKTISKEAKKYISEIVPADQRKELSEEFRTLVDVLDCIFEDIIDSLVNLIAELLTPLIGAVAQGIQCLYDNFVANVLANILEILKSRLSSVLGLINLLIGGVVDVAGVFSSALQTILEFIDGCEQKKQITDNSCYDAKNRTTRSSIFTIVNSLTRIADIPNTGVQLFNQAQATANGLLAPVVLGPIADPKICLPNFFQFGPPIITVVNGSQSTGGTTSPGSGGTGPGGSGSNTTGGTGAGGGTGTETVGTGKTCSFTIIPVIKNGQVIGGITEGDACGCSEDITLNVQAEIGRGAVLRVIVNKDCQSDKCVQDVVVLDPGSGYLNTNYIQPVYELDEDGILPKNFNLENYSNLKCLRDRIQERLDNVQSLEPVAKEVGGGNSSNLIPVLDKIVIVNPGSGYCADNTVSVFDGDKEICKNLPIKIGPIGEILEVDQSCKVPVNSLPRIVINNPCGDFAELKPVLDFKDPKDIQTPGSADKIIKVVRCLQK